MIGQTVSHYKILDKLGEGGMGVVYKAIDTKLDRPVALKFLPPELTRDPDAKHRFVHEAKAASALQHNNICTIHEIDEIKDGHLFIAMDCYEGETLKQRIAGGPIPVREAIDIAFQVAEGLSKAHAAGMVHRDIKPANIMITKDGVVKILDFGLAKLAGQTKVTKTGTTVGTVAYMSPEQARGDEIDAGSDIWSLGVMLYEMLSGRLPFQGDVEPAILYAIMNKDPEPLKTMSGDVPIGVEDIVEKTLMKERASRYQTMDDLLLNLGVQRDQITLGIKQRQFRILRRLRRRKQLAAVVITVILMGTAALTVTVFHGRRVAIDAIAVLPLENLSRDSEQESFVGGMTIALITEISRIGALRVISKPSVMRYKETHKTMSQIARELNVDAVVTGSVFRTGERVRITVQLNGVKPERLLWADDYDRDLVDILALFSDIARSVAREIRVTLTPQEQSRLTSTRSVNSEAYDMYIRGLYHIDRFKTEDLKKGITCFQRAIEIDPDYAEPYAMLAGGYLGLYYLDSLSREETRSRMDPPIRKALAIDDELPRAHYIMAAIKHYFDWDWTGAEEGYRHAIALDPNLAQAHSDYSYLLTQLGRSAEAISESKRALELDPFLYEINQAAFYAYTYAGDYERAAKQLERILEWDPKDARAQWGFVYLYEQTGKFDEAVAKISTIPGVLPKVIAALDSAYTESGRIGYWMWRLQRLKSFDDSPASVARFYAQLGDKDKAFYWLEKAYEKHDGALCFLKVSSSWESMRDDPRYKDLLRRMNFPENKPST